MFARSVSIRLRQGTAEEFIHLFENEAIPLLREQDGFQQVITLINPDRTEVVALSLWSENNSRRRTTSRRIETFSRDWRTCSTAALT